MNNCSNHPSPLLSQIPEEMNRCRNSYMEQALLPQRLEELAGEEAAHGGYRAYLQDSLDTLLKEAKDKFKGYDSCSTPEHADLAYRKVGPLFFFFLHLSLGPLKCHLFSLCGYFQPGNIDKIVRQLTGKIYYLSIECKQAVTPETCTPSLFPLLSFPLSPCPASLLTLNIEWKTCS